MSDKKKRELELLDDALDDVEATPEQIASTMSRLSTTPAAWAAEVRARVEAAREQARKARLQQMRLDYQRERERYEARPSERVQSKAEMQLVLKNLLAEAPAAVSANFHKYEDAPAEELAEQIRSLRYLLGKKDDES
jgi:hypothetical protein